MAGDLWGVHENARPLAEARWGSGRKVATTRRGEPEARYVGGRSPTLDDTVIVFGSDGWHVSVDESRGGVGAR